MVSRISTISLSVENPQDAPKEETANFEEAMEICGNGRYQYTFLLVCGILFFCIGLQTGINAYIMPSAECDLNMGSEEKGFLNVSFLIGSVLSALFWGVFAGAYGRRNIILVTIFSDSLMTIIASIVPTYKLFLIFRTMSGFLIGTPGSLIYSYLGEFHAEKHRAKSICLLGFFLPLSWLLLPALAWIILPLPISFEMYGMQFNSWRIFLCAISIPSITVGVIILLGYPESPKFLLSQGKSDKALAIFQNIYAVNTGCDKSEFPVKKLLSETTIAGRKDKLINKLSTSDMLIELLKNIWQQLRTIASPPYWKYALLLWTIYATNTFGYYGIGLWMPELFHRFENYQNSHPNASLTVCEVIREMYNSPNMTVPEESILLLTERNITECKPHIDKRVFTHSLTINAASLIGSITSAYLSNRVDRRAMPVAAMLMAGFAGFGLYFVRSSLQILIVACIFCLMITTANFPIAAVAVNVFPTHVSAAAICMMVCLGRISAVISNLSFGMLLDLSCEIPIFLLAGIVTFGGLLAFLIPSKEKK